MFTKIALAILPIKSKSSVQLRKLIVGNPLDKLVPQIITFSASEHERHSVPSLVLDLDHRESIGGGDGPFWHRLVVQVAKLGITLALGVSSVLPQNTVGQLQGVDTLQHLDLNVGFRKVWIFENFNFMPSRNGCRPDARRLASPWRRGTESAASGSASRRG